MTTTILAEDAANTIYNWLVLGTSAASGDRWLTLYSDVAGGTEVAVDRVDVTTIFGSPSEGDGTNTSSVSFDLPAFITAVDGVGIWDDETAGNELVRWSVTGRTYPSSATCVMNVNDLFLNVDGVT